MPITAEQRAEINRQNAQKSTGPKTEAGKLAARQNALKHGLTATTIAPVDAPGEPHGAYQAQLDAWVEDLQPRNVLEHAMIARACRASWKLDRCARYEDAAAALREARNDSQVDPDRPTQRGEAHQLGMFLMFQLDSNPYGTSTTPPEAPTPFDDAPGHADSLCRFKEGVEWLLDAWAGVLPNLPGDGDPPPAGSDEFVRRTRLRALRLLGVPTGAPDLAQPLRAAGEAEVRRLEALRAEMSTRDAARLDTDLALFSAGPEAQLLMRYEALAERALHRAVTTFLALRKDPDLVPAAAPAAAPPPASAPAAARSEPSPARNEPSPPARSHPSDRAGTAPAAAREPRNGSP